MTRQRHWQQVGRGTVAESNIYLSFFNYHLSRVYISEGLIPLQNIFHSLSFNFTGNEAVSPSESGVGDGDGIPTPGNSGREVLDNFKFVVQNLSM